MNTENNVPDSPKDSLLQRFLQDKASSKRRGRRSRLLGLSLLFFIVMLLAQGMWRHNLKSVQVREAAAKVTDQSTKVRVGEIRASTNEYALKLPATTSAFESANIFARASGYNEKRFVDIGSHEITGDVLAIITAPELDHQIALALQSGST